MRYPDVVPVLAATVLSWVLGSYFLNHFEAPVNADFSPLWKSFFSIFLYLIPFVAKAPLTPDGQTTIQVLHWLGLALIAGFLRPLIQRLAKAEFWNPFIAWLQGRPIMDKEISGHMVMINWDH